MNHDSGALVWFRRDLRVDDHAALHHALSRHGRAYCCFVFDTEILEALDDRCDRRVEFIWESVRELDSRLRQMGGALAVLRGRARDVLPRYAAALRVGAVYANRDYEPAAVDRDARVGTQLARQGTELHLCKDQVIFEGDEILTAGGRPFKVFTPYRDAWLRKVGASDVAPHAVETYAQHLAADPQAPPMPSIEEIGFRRTNLQELPLPCGMSGAGRMFSEFIDRIDDYRRVRDYPALKGPSYLSVHLRFGTISIRKLVAFAVHRGSEGAQAWLNELIWREFYAMILAQRPDVVSRAFKPEFDRLAWDDDPELFAAWCDGRTGYPLVDAAMRQLNRTGYMHNRLRMLTASFLTKDLAIDWRLGERYFARKLNDFDLASNNGGWQWAASTGCDAQPYFRMFNPVTQSEKFDPEGRFIRRYVPELAGCDSRRIHAPWLMSEAQQAAAGVLIGRDYPRPVVDHATARLRTLERYKAVPRLRG
jgi:deoxyribodipyrimidine photo-lyase